MSIDDQKNAIATALSTIEGITGYNGRPDALNPGDMFVRWGGWQRADGDAFLAVWTATLVLPQSSERDADAEAYRVADLIADALQPFMYITAFDPTTIPVTGERGLYALTVTGRSE